NSGLSRSPSTEALAGSAFAARGTLQVEQHPFVDFADMRNRAFGMLRGLERPPDWVLFLDADEVHGEQVRYLAREVLPRLPPPSGQVSPHYGNVATPQALAEKHGKYFALGNKVPQPPAPEVADAGLFLEAARRVRPFHGAHPAAARPTVARLKAEPAGGSAAPGGGLRARRAPGARPLGTLRGLNESFRLQLPRLE